MPRTKRLGRRSTTVAASAWQTKQWAAVSQSPKEGEKNFVNSTRQARAGIFSSLQRRVDCSREFSLPFEHRFLKLIIS